ncbi:Uncharacterised protein [Bordetella trematum]|nr:Uncharacterised protein [Bordetella trematum]VDH07624.1 Uncharacterised protein [Bordetella trematum]
MQPWNVYPRRTWFRHAVARITYSNFAGAWYEIYQEGGRVRRFWTAKGAQRFADQLNAAPSSQGEGR